MLLEPTQVLAPYPGEHVDALGEQPRFRGYLNVDGTHVQSDVPVEVIGQRNRMRRPPFDASTLWAAVQTHVEPRDHALSSPPPKAPPPKGVEIATSHCDHY